MRKPVADLTPPELTLVLARLLYPEAYRIEITKHGIEVTDVMKGARGYTGFIFELNWQTVGPLVEKLIASEVLFFYNPLEKKYGVMPCNGFKKITDKSFVELVTRCYIASEIGEEVEV